MNGIGDVEAVRCRNGCGAGGICGDNGMIVIALNDADNIGIGACPCKRANNLSVRIGSIECIELIDCQAVADNKGCIFPVQLNHILFVVHADVNIVIVACIVHCS